MKPDVSIMPSRPNGKPPKRKPLTRAQVVEICRSQVGACDIMCGCGCGKPLDPLGEGIIDEHIIPREAGGSDELSNRAFYRKPCAASKTNEKDKAVIARVKRKAGETGQQKRRSEGKTQKIPTRKNAWQKGRKIPSRKFS